MNCSAKTDASSMALIAWKIHGKPLNKSDPRVVVTGLDSHSTLTIMSAKASDTGAYQCIARNNQSGVVEECPEVIVTVHCKYY